MVLYTTMRIGWEWEYGQGNGREWDRKSYFRIFLICMTQCGINACLLLLTCLLFFIYIEQYMNVEAIFILLQCEPYINLKTSHIG